MSLIGKRVLLIIGGGIAAYKTLELIRGLRKEGAAVRAVLTDGGAEFVTPLSLGALTEDKVYQSLFDLTDEAEMGHIELSRQADLVVVAPATADLMAKMASGIASDLASTVLMATDKPVLIAPAMNVRMWEHPATQRNLATLARDGVRAVGPNEGDMACGEFGFGRMAEPDEILNAIKNTLGDGSVLKGARALVTSGPTHEPIDPVRYLANRSSGKQGHAIAAALAGLGAETTLITGPTGQADPFGVNVIHVQTAQEMLAACESALPADVAVFAAAVADWRADAPANAKLKKNGATSTDLKLVQNPDILATIAQLSQTKRPRLVVGFAAETDNVVEHAKAKREKKACDWLIANDVSASTGIMGGDENEIHLITEAGVEDWPRLGKREVAAKLAARIASHLKGAAA
jgi:phosphopantothenoylcysteine decarboxylase/phosphopantothenate--cysteine ligase